MVTALLIVLFSLVALRLVVAVVGMLMGANEFEAHARAVAAERRPATVMPIVFSETFERVAA